MNSKSQKKLNVILLITSLLMSFLGISCSSNKRSSELSEQLYFVPSKNGNVQPFVGDVMPYYQDGTYYFYYLKDGGDSFRHSIYLATTKDFITYTEYKEPVLQTLGEGQEEWIGTGSVVKVKKTYYFFYTAHADSSDLEYKEKIFVAKSNNLYNFERIDEFEIIPDDSLGQKRDFRDPQAYYDEETGLINITVTASKNGKAVILKYTVNNSLSEVSYDGVIFEDPTSSFWNLECSDTFKIGNYWYLTYSAQDDTLWYAKSDSRYGPYTEPKPFEGKLFYAAKHVNGKDGDFLAGWIRRSSSPSSLSVTAWGGNLSVQKIQQDVSGNLYLSLPDSVNDYIKKRYSKIVEDEINLDALKHNCIYNLGLCSDSYILQGQFSFNGNGSFGLSFDTNGNTANNKLIVIDADNQFIKLTFNQQDILITQKQINVKENKTYNFSFIQQGNIGVFYIEDNACLTVRLYKTEGKQVAIFADSLDLNLKYSLYSNGVNFEF